MIESPLEELQKQLDTTGIVQNILLYHPIAVLKPPPQYPFYLPQVLMDEVLHEVDL